LAEFAGGSMNGYLLDQSVEFTVVGQAIGHSVSAISQHWYVGHCDPHVRRKRKISDALESITGDCVRPGKDRLALCYGESNRLWKAP